MNFALENTTKQTFTLQRFQEDSFQRALAAFVGGSGACALPDRYQIERVHLLSSDGTLYPMTVSANVNSCWRCHFVPEDSIEDVTRVAVRFKDGTEEVVEVDAIHHSGGMEQDIVISLAG